HEVVATTRSQDKFDRLWAQGARPITLDVLDADAVRSAVVEFRPEAIVHQATALSALGNNFRHFDRLFATTNLLRTKGTENLLAAGREVGTSRFVAQSYRWAFTDAAGQITADPPKAFRQSAAALRRVEELVLQTPGAVALRYGSFYGPNTSLARSGPQIKAIGRRQLPIIGGGGGIWTFLHVQDAATATLAALTRGEGVYTVIDDEPAPVREWLPYLASVLGAKPPRHLPAGLAKLAAGAGATWMMTKAPGASNAAAKRDLAWTPSRKSWRDGFLAELG
ncbi:MAG: NAD-dependent epimerase/dehydratase family protein, partial [Actinomycetes bacterium]